MTGKSVQQDIPASSQTLRLRLLGGFQVSVGEHPALENQWRLRKSKSLIKLLALAPQHQLHRDQLLDTLWGSLAPPEANHNLHQALYVARRVLGATHKASEFLRLHEEVLRLGPEQLVQIDVDAFETAARRARAVRSPPAYLAAIDLYGGELLPDDRYEEWAAPRRDALSREHAALLNELSALYELRREFGAAVDSTRRLLQVDPIHEDAHRRLMRTLAQTGERQQALRQYEVLRAALNGELDAEPDRASKALYDDILAGRLPDAEAEPAPSLLSTPNNLPIQLTSFVGRERELSELGRLLTTTRLLTLTGSGGTGKTRLSLQLAAGVLDQYKDGIWFVELAPLADAALVPQTVANVLGVYEASARPMQTILIDWLKTRQILLILDNCEHLIDACAGFADAVLRASHGTRILATSREALRISGETAYRVPSLECPDPAQARNDSAEQLMHYAAVHLFSERAAQALTAFHFTDGNAKAIAHICNRLEGIPLAIELAAARVRGLSVEQIAARLDDCFQLLTGGNRAALPRHRTLRALIDWSYDLLPEPEQRLLQRLSVFAGGWTVEAAEHVCAGDGIAQDQAIDLLMQLQDKSLVARLDHERHARYRLLETVRQYALEQLAASGQVDVVRDRHLAWFTQLAEESEPRLRSIERAAAHAMLEEDYDNFRAAIAWALERRSDAALRLVGSLYLFWDTTGHRIEGHTMSERALTTFGVLPGLDEHVSSDLPRSDAATPARVRGEAKTLMMAGSQAFQQGDYRAAESRFQAADTRAREFDDQTIQVWLPVEHGMLKLYQGDHAKAQALFEQAIVLARHVKDLWSLAYALWLLGDAVAMDDPDSARKVYEESLSLFRQVSDHVFATSPLTSLAHLASEQGNFVQAEALLRESLAIRRNQPDHYMTSISLNSLAEVLCQQQDYESAAHLCDEALHLGKELGNKSGIAWSLRNLADVASGQNDVRRAEVLLHESLGLYRELGQRLDIVHVIEALARVAATRSRPGRAAVLMGAADMIRQSVNAVRSPRQRIAIKQAVAMTCNLLGNDAYEAAFAQGRTMSMEQAIDLALSERVCI